MRNAWKNKTFFRTQKKKKKKKKTVDYLGAKNQVIKYLLRLYNN